MTEFNKRIVLLDYVLDPPSGGGPIPWVARQAYLTSLLRRRGVGLVFPSARITADGSAEPDLEQTLLASMEYASAAVMIGIPGGLRSKAVLDTVLRRLREGMRIWSAVPTLSDLEWGLRSGSQSAHLYKEFLDAVGVELTDVGLISAAGHLGHPRSFEIDRKKYPASFRHPELFRGVENILFQQAQALRLHGEAQAAAAVTPEPPFDIVDLRTDLFCFDWNEPDFAVVAIAYIGDSGGCVIATSGLTVGDPYTGATGIHFPGGEKNEAVLNNLISVLQLNHSQTALLREVDVHAIIQSIERNLLEVIREVLGTEWPECLDPAIKAKAEQRRAGERSVIPWWAYLDLSDHINTMAKNIPRFREVLEGCGLPSSRNKLEREVLRTGKLIELRILDSHVTKRVIMDHEFSAADFKVLREVEHNVLCLWRRVKRPAAFPDKT